MSKLRPIPTAGQPWFGANGQPLQYEYLFDLDRYVRGLTSGGGGGDAATLNGQAGAYYLAWANFTGVPATFPPSAHTHAQADVTGLVSDLAAKQPLDSDLTAIAALTTTTFGRSLLTQADDSALRSTAGVVIGTDVVAQSHVGSGGAAHANVIAAGAAGFMTGADKTKLDGIAAGADVTASSFGAWSTWTPTVSAQSGTVTGATISTTAKYKAIGKLVFWKISCTITNIGSGSPGGAVMFSSPSGLTPLDTYNPANSYYVNIGANAGGFISSDGHAYAFKADGSTLWANGNVFTIGGSYEAA